MAGAQGNEAVKVIVRCRPMNKREKDLKSQNVVFMDQATYSCSLVNPKEPNVPAKSFAFDGAYGPDSTTEAIYNDNGFALVEGVLEGYNGTVFAYGQTGCGKSFSMQGIPNPATQRGIIPRAFEHIFEAIDASENMKYLVQASYLEIYNEEIRDLLGEDIKKKLDLKEHPELGIYVNKLSLHSVHNTQECEAMMVRGWNNRATGSTNMNAESSRSHSIFTVNIEMMDTTQGEHIRKGKLNLVDLAGSERQAKTGASGDRLKEANKINMSLSALGNVISALVDGKSKHIPYRDSKLTRILQDSLGGNTKTMMVACLSPADNNYDETLSTLRYANRAKNIKNKPKINEDPKDAMLREYQTEIAKLKELLEKGGPVPSPNHNGVSMSTVPSEEMLEAERLRVRQEYENDMEEIRKKYQSEQESKAKIQAEVEEMRSHYEEKLKEVNEKSSQNNSEEIDTEQKLAVEKLKKLQASLVDGGKRAGDMDLKERRLKRKKAAEKRMKVLGEALGHVDSEDGVLVKVYDDIQTELSEKTAALKKLKQRVRGLNSEISDLQSEFEKDRQDYLDTIRKQDQQLLLLQAILDKIQPTIRKDCNYSNIDRMKNESVWMEENQWWRIPELLIHKTKLPPAGSFGQLAGVAGGEGEAGGGIQGVEVRRAEPGQGLSRTAPGRLQGMEDDSDDENSHLLKKLAKSEEEDIAGNYFKPKRASRLMAQAKETQRTLNKSVPRSGYSSSPASSSHQHSSSNLATSFNSGLNTVGLNNSYAINNKETRSFGQPSIAPSWLNSGPSPMEMDLDDRGGGHGHGYGGGVELAPIMRKPSRLEALPTLSSLNKVNNNNGKKKSIPVLNTMGTF